MADDNERVGTPEIVDLTPEFDDLSHRIRTTPYSPEDEREVRPYDPSRTREWVRAAIALLLIGLLTGTIAASFAILWIGPFGISDTKELLAVLLSPLVGLVGAATGFYYGSK